MLMNAELYQRLNYEIMMLEKAKEEYSGRLDLLGDFKGAFLQRTKPGRGKNYYYSVKRKGSKTYAYLGPTDNRIVKRVQEVRFLKEAIRRIDLDLSLMKAFADGFLPYDASHINESLPAVYRCDVPPSSELYEIEGKKWLERRLDYQKSFPENYPEKKTHRTSDGVFVKTVSEVALYEMVKSAGLALIYELPLPLKDYGPPLYPDVTVLSPIDMKTEIIIEYVGRLDLREYREEFARKIDRYLRNGYRLGVNLFFVLSDSEGHIDSMQISRVIADILGIRNETAE